MRRWVTNLFTFCNSPSTRTIFAAISKSVPIDAKRHLSLGPSEIGRSLAQQIESTNLRPQHLLEWANDFEQDTRDQAEYVREQQEAFPEALKLLKSMSTGAGHYHIHETDSRITDHDHNTRPFKSDANENLTTPQSWLLQKIYFLTGKENSTQSGIICGQLKNLLSDPQSAPGLSVQAYIIAVSYCLRVYNFKLLRYFMKHSQQHNIVANIALCNTVLGIFVHEKDLLSWTGALQMFANIGIKAETDTWNQFLTLCNRAQKVAAYRQMTLLGIRCDQITEGIMLPINRAKFSTTQAFLQSLESHKWSGRFGDVLIGELCATKDLRIAIDMLQKPEFRCTIEGVDQLLASVLRTSADRLNHHKLTRQICRGWTERGLRPRKRTFYLLLKMNRRIKSVKYAQMIETTAAMQGLESFAFRKEQASLTNGKTIGGPKIRDSKSNYTAWDWVDWLQKS